MSQFVPEKQAQARAASLLLAQRVRNYFKDEDHRNQNNLADGDFSFFLFGLNQTSCHLHMPPFLPDTVFAELLGDKVGGGDHDKANDGLEKTNGCSAVKLCIGDTGSVYKGGKNV